MKKRNRHSADRRFVFSGGSFLRTLAGSAAGSIETENAGAGRGGGSSPEVFRLSGKRGRRRLLGRRGCLPCVSGSLCRMGGRSDGSIGLQRGIWQPSAAPGAGKRASSGADRGNGASLPKRRGQSGTSKALGTPQCAEVRIINGKRPFASKTRCGGSLFRSFSGNVQTTVTEGFYNKEKPEKEEVQ